MQHDSVGFNQTGQNIYGPQTNITGDVYGTVLSGIFNAPVTVSARIAAAAAAAPPPPEHFVGRQRELQAVADALTMRNAPVAITGMGGVGKSTLARKVAAHVGNQFRGGVWWAALADHAGNPGPILDTWARLCGHHPATLAPDPAARAATVRGFLVERSQQNGRMLLVIDDLREEWLQGVEVLQAARPQAAALLMTTRNAELAAEAEIYPLDELSGREALALLERLGRDVVRHQQKDARRLIDQVAALPKALEMAGMLIALRAKKPGWQLGTLVDELARRPADEVLRLGGHAGLAATFLVSYDSLDTKEQQAFRALAAFSPVPMTAAIVAVGMQLETREAEALLDGLVNLSLVHWVPGGRAVRYAEHPLLYQFAQRLTPADEREAFRAPVLATLRRAISDPGLSDYERRSTGHSLTALRWLDSVTNVTPADLIVYLELIVRYVHAPAQRAYLAEAIQRYLTKQDGPGSPAPDLRQRAQLLVYRAALLAWQGEIDAALADAREARALILELPAIGEALPEDSLLRARNAFGLATMEGNHYFANPTPDSPSGLHRTMHLYREAVQAAEAYDKDPVLLAGIHAEMADMAGRGRLWRTAVRHARLARAILTPEAHGVDYATVLERTSWVYSELAETFAERGELERADQALWQTFRLRRRAIAVLRKHGQDGQNGGDMAWLVTNTAEALAAMQGRRNGGQRFQRAARSLCRYTERAISIAAENGVTDAEEFARGLNDQHCAAG